MRSRPRRNAQRNAAASPAGATSSWTPLGPAPLASDASGTGLQDYRQVTGRATAVAIDPADPTGNTVYSGGTQGGVWKSTNAANSDSSTVTWTPLTDDQATLSIGAIAIQPGNSDPANSVILAGTGEGNNSTDSYFGLGILRSADAGNTWTLISTADNNSLSLTGLGAARMAFNSSSTVVAAMATTPANTIEDAASSAKPGLFTSLDAGQSWNYNALLDPGGLATDATSATSIAYNTSAGLFFAAVRYHGFYSSPDGTTWTRLATQPAGSMLTTAACPAQSTGNNQICPIFRGEITVVPGRNEMYFWFISLDGAGNAVDQGIWSSTNGGGTWTQTSDSGILNCGDVAGCGVEQGDYNLEVLAAPNGNSATDLYAGAANLYKCSINSGNPQCSNNPFLNLTHVYGCDPLGAPAHVHPAQHALAYMKPSAGSDAGNALLYFANDGGIYRALSAGTGLNTGDCSGTNQFDDLNQNLGSLTQFVGLAQDPTDAQTMLGGAQGNGSPATSTAANGLGWFTVNGGDGGFTAIDANAPLDWFTSTPDIAPGGLNIQQCGNGANCRVSNFNVAVDSAQVGGDDGAFYVPYVLDPQSTDAMLVGTCRVWRGSRAGGAFTVLSPNFDTFGAGLCTGSEINLVRSIAAGGPIDGGGSRVVYATTDGAGPNNATSPVGGHVWATSNASAGPSSYLDVTQNINPHHFPISSVAIDALDATGNTAFVGIMGFTGGAGHIWRTSDGGATWIDFTGTSTPLPDAPVITLLVDSTTSTIYAGTDVGIFQSSDLTPQWSEVGPAAGSGQPGFLPNVAVTALTFFSSGTQKLLRAATYGRGVWQYDLNPIEDFQISIPNIEQTFFSGQTPSFHGTATSIDGYSNSISLICVSGATNPPADCSANPATFIPGTNTPFAFTTAGNVGDFNFYAQADGFDAQNTTHRVLLTLHVVSFNMTTPSPDTVVVPRGATSPPVSFQVTAAGSFNQAVSVACSVNIAASTCNLAPGPTVHPTASAPVNMTASVSVPQGTTPGNYPVNLQATTSGAPAPLTTSFTLAVTTNPDFILSEPTSFPLIRAGSTNTSGPVNIASQDGFSTTVNLSCSLNSGSGNCSTAPGSVSSYPASTTVTVNATSLSAGSYQLTVTGASGATTHTLIFPVQAGDYQLTGPQSLTLSPGAQAQIPLTIAASTYYSGQINAACDATALPGAGCTLLPANPITVSTAAIIPLTVTLRIPNDAAAGTFPIHISAQDASGQPAHSLTMQVTVGEDYTIGNLSPSSQTISAGQSASYNFSVFPVGTSYDSQITLKCIVAPVFLGTCTFSPNPVPALTNSTSASVVMTVSTQATTGALLPPDAGRPLYFALLMLPAILLGSARKHRLSAAAFSLTLTCLLLLASCGGGSNGDINKRHNGTTPGTYTITVTGTPASAGQTNPPSTTLIVQ